MSEDQKILTRSVKVQVWNDHTKDHREELQGEMIVVPAGSYIEMPRAKAIKYVAQFWPVYKPGETNTPPKMLRVVEPRKEAVAKLERASREHACMACDQGFNTQRELDVHIEMNHEHLMVDEEGVKNVKKASKPKPKRQRTGS